MVTNKDGGDEIPELEFSGSVLSGDTGALANCRFAVIVSTYHPNITGALLSGAISELRENDVPDSGIDVVHVPGAWELSLAAARIVGTDVDAVICLGCVIKGETSHDQHINFSVSASLGQLAVDSGIPIAFGLLTCNSKQQALDRAGGAIGNKGIEAASAAIHMVRLFQQLDG